MIFFGGLVEYLGLLFELNWVDGESYAKYVVTMSDVVMSYSYSI